MSFNPMRLKEKIAEKLNGIDPHKLVVSEEIRQERLDICKSCEFLSTKLWTCKKCGCFLHAKTKISWAECPLKKWRAIPSSKL